MFAWGSVTTQDTHDQSSKSGLQENQEWGCLLSSLLQCSVSLLLLSAKTDLLMHGKIHHDGAGDQDGLAWRHCLAMTPALLCTQLWCLPLLGPPHPDLRVTLQGATNQQSVYFLSLCSVTVNACLFITYFKQNYKMPNTWVKIARSEIRNSNRDLQATKHFVGFMVRHTHKNIMTIKKNFFLAHLQYTRSWTPSYCLQN